MGRIQRIALILFFPLSIFYLLYLVVKNDRFTPKDSI